MVRTVVQIIAKNPPSILLALGGLGVLADIGGAGWLLASGVGLQLVWLARFFV